jgi:hypothetical protein
MDTAVSTFGTEADREGTVAKTEDVSLEMYLRSEERSRTVHGYQTKHCFDKECI